MYHENYIHAVCDDLDMKYVDYYSADMYDLLIADRRKKLECFFGLFVDATEKKLDITKKYNPIKQNVINYIPSLEGIKIDPDYKKIMVVADLEEENNLRKMVDKFSETLNGKIELVDINKLSIKGGCIGCIRCGYNNQCFYEEKDEFINFYKEKLIAADIIIFVGKIKDRYLSARWKMFFDRSFFNTHTPSLTGKQIGFIITGPLRQIPNLNEILSAYVEWQGANLCGIATDEYDHSSDIDKALCHLATQSIRFSEKKYIRTSTFLGIGGMKIFRDDMWGRLRFPFVSDHKYYKKNGVYDFPHKDYKTRITNVILHMMIKIPSIREKYI